MERIIVDVSWCNKNFGASLSENVPGAVVLTAKTFEEMQQEVQETLRFHLDGMVKDGDEVPQWLVDGDYEFEYHYHDIAALLQAYGSDLTLSAISRASGINQRQLSHYANGIKRPSAKQRQKIVDGIHHIGKSLMSI